MRALLVSLLWGLTLAAVGANPPSGATVQEDPLERQVLEISKDLRCTVCQNQPVSESNADLAKDMRAIIREQLKAGKSREDIMAYFVDRYGDYVLLKPRKSGIGAPLWVAPVALLVLLGLLAAYFIRSHLRTEPPPPPLSREDRERVRAAREQVER